MASMQLSVFDFLSVTASINSINDANLAQIRSNNFISNLNDAPNEQTLKNIAQQLRLFDDPINLQHLKICLSGEDDFDVKVKLVEIYFMKSLLPNPMNIIPQSNVQIKQTIETELVRQITCYIHVKQDRKSVEQFIEEFLFTSLIKKQNDHANRGNASRSAINKVPSSTRFTQGCVLDVFIRTQLSTRGVVNTGYSLTKLQLAEPLTLEDEFDTWYFDYMRGLFDIWLIPTNSQTFPLKWSITEDAEILFTVGNKSISAIDDANNTSAIGNIDRPSTVSLEKFINDICEKENNGNTERWLEGLRNEDIRSYSHLANLKFTEWEQMKSLSTNARKILKSYVDREKQLRVEVKKTSESKTDIDQGPKLPSKSQLIAYLHQIKLYFHYMLDEYFQQARIPQPAQVNVQCVDLAFEEMRSEGFADDGLFDQMKPFFLPLTMVEQDIEVTDRQWIQLENDLSNRQTLLRIEKAKLEDEMAELGGKYYQLDDKVVQLKASASRQTTTNLINSRDNQDETGSPSLQQQIVNCRSMMDELQPSRNQLRTKWNQLNDLISNIETALQSRKTRSSDSDLIKPNRGFIMYGPPGTGKSDIMSKVSTRLGINMVTPPIAAGELDRPLVGESERIISDICMRCHRLPYLMCCVSIDEIDSLAPKRTNNASHSDVSKLSVLLSVIDGIKDVRNLMFFCATNRIHMMDEAFLRRMSGKFFVGRPSSHARKAILSGMKTWHLNPSMLEDLAMATTNFSGAALRALRRSITAHCINVLRTNSSYHIVYRTVLEHAHEIALKYRIMIGAETLPDLLLRNLNETRPAEPWGLSNRRNSVYTGKILINLSKKKAYVEAVITHNNGEKEKIVYQDTLTERETDLKQLIERLVYYGKSRNVQLLQLVDLNLLLSESAYNEERKFEILKERVEESSSYRRSMIVFDLDSLIGVNKSEGYAALGNSTNVSLINQNVNIYIREKFRDAYCQAPFTNREQDDEELDKLEEKWSVIVVRESYLYRQFCSGDHQFTRLPEEIEEEEEQLRQSEQNLLCVKCKNNYTEQENKMGQCVYHDGFVYDCSSISLKMFPQSTGIQALITEEAQLLRNINITNEQKERHERGKQRFKFICCNQTLQISGNMGGCKKAKHQDLTKEEWENQCNNNGCYLQKWRDILNALDENNEVGSVTYNSISRRETLPGSNFNRSTAFESDLSTSKKIIKKH
ncbi:unnamed protein product [Rotaria socialis]